MANVLKAILPITIMSITGLAVGWRIEGGVVDAVHAYEQEGADRWEALRRMTVEYVVRMHTNTPVHEWEPV